MGSQKYRFAAAVCSLIFIASAILSYIYAEVTGTYNGDFLGAPVELGSAALLGISVLAVLPIAIGWGMYRYFVGARVSWVIPVLPSTVTWLFFLFTTWFIFLALKYQVGVLGMPLYDAPGSIKPLIQVSNRVNPYYLGVLFILAFKGPRKILVLGILALVALGLVRASLGVFMYIGLALLLRNGEGLLTWLKANLGKAIFIVLFFPFLVSQLYQLRSSLRGTQEELAGVSAVQLVAARLFGRLSSFSDTAVLYQERDVVQADVQRLGEFYFAEQALGGVFGAALIPEATPERLMVNVYGGDLFDVSYMTGLAGNYFVSWLISPVILITNILLTAALCISAFLIARRIGHPASNEYAFILLLYPLVSGVASEFSSLVASIASIAVLLLVAALIRAILGGIRVARSVDGR